MRFMKALLVCMFSFIGAFFTACYVSWLITGREPEALINGVAAAGGVEALVAGAIRVFENFQHHKHEKEMRDDACCTCEEPAETADIPNEDKP